MELATKPPKQATEVRQAGLVAAALQLAAQRNPADITTADLARAVGITQGAVFRHFASKEAIWLAVLNWATETLLARLHAAAAGSGGTDPHCGAARGPTPLHALQAIFAAHVDFVMEHPGVPRVIFQELQHAQDTALKARVRNLMQQYRMLVMGQLQRAQAQNLLVPGTDLQAAAVLFLGAVQGLVMQAMVSGQVQTIAAQAPGVFTIYLRGIVRSSTSSVESTP
jgi:AcrR family transcriptional regulator